MARIRSVVALALLVVGCGSPLKKDKSSEDGNNTTQQSFCGDGIVDGDETCDPALDGSCPESCFQSDSCGTFELTGSAEDCTADCVETPAPCGISDGCCPGGCDAQLDDDCTNRCGDGVVDGPELCDGDCPTACDSTDACQVGTMTGSAERCDAECSYSLVTSCIDSDGCCPAGCDEPSDSDCTGPVCGDGKIDAGELCDGNCPSSCDDGQACTNDVLVGSPGTCDAQCGNTTITNCVDGDGCCASGCSFANDDDCACVPRTCAQMGAKCGTIEDGCGNMVTCSSSCTASEACEQNQCVEQNFVGADCTDSTQCGASADAACIIAPEWVGGYCTEFCNSNSDCPSSTHCATFDSQNQLCMLDCTSDAQCDFGYYCRQYDGVGGRECVPPEQVGDGVIGDLCTNDDDCGFALTCYMSTPTFEGGTAIFAGGLCSKPCSVGSTTCGNGNVCTRDGLCTTSCVFGDDCRQDWQCQFNAQVLDSHCWPG